jgi:hypothetical protein
MKELSTPDKIRLLEGALKHPTHHGLCSRISEKAINLKYISLCEYSSLDYKYFICKTLVPEFCQIKPVNIDPDEAYCNYWFGPPGMEGFPKRQAALEQLIEIIKSKP